MAELATRLLRTVTRAFYQTEHILVIDALLIHSTLSDSDLAYALQMQTKSLRKICGRLKEDGLLSVQSRAEKRTDGTQSFYGTAQGPNRERLSHKDWYYINFHKAIDSIKYKMAKLNKHVESLGAPTAEKKELVCPRCKSQYTSLEAMDHMDYTTGIRSCGKCGHQLEDVDEDARTNENETMKRLNSQLEKILGLLQQIDQTTVPENDFQTALSVAKPINRKEDNPGQQRTEVVDLPNRNLQSTKGLDIKPEKIAVQVQDDEEIKRENAANDAAARREKEARQNALPDWIAKSTVSGDITAVGAKEQRLKHEREANAAVTRDGDSDEKKPLKDEDEESKMKEYFAELEKANALAAAAAKSEDEEDEDDEDDFEDVDVTGTGANGTPMRNGNGVNGSRGSASGMNTPNINSSNASDDERDAKRVKSEAAATSSSAQSNVGPAKPAQDTPAVSDDDDEEDGLDFEDV
jgi:transcription initiation factor TFIIE subunit alpha